MVKNEYEATIIVRMDATNPQLIRAVLGGMLQRLVAENTNVRETDLQSIKVITSTD